MRKKTKFDKTIAEVQHGYGISDEDLQAFIEMCPECCEFDDAGSVLYINTKRKDFADLVKNAPEHRPQGKSKRLKKNKFQILQEKALEADLEAKVYKAEIKKSQSQKERMILERKRDELISHEEAKYFYFEYLNKLNLEIFRLDHKLIQYLTKNLQQLIMPEILHELTVGFRKLYEGQISGTIAAITEEQKKEVERR